MKAPSALVDAAELAIRDCRSTPNLVLGTGEVAEVARLVLQLPKKLVQRWSGLLAAGALEVTGVFAHKTPKARWTDPRDNKSRLPELCDLLLVLDCEDAGVHTRRALLIQAKVADANTTAGQFTVAKNSPAIQRYLYAHWPKFTLTGLRPKPPSFNIAPLPKGACPGTRYACINVNAPAPASGWWLEKAQPVIPTLAAATTLGALGASSVPGGSVGYDGTFYATLPLGRALRDMVAGTLGAPLTKGSEWERLVQHLEAVAQKRHKAGKNPADVAPTAVGTLLPHQATASLFMANQPRYFEWYSIDNFIQWGSAVPPDREGTLLTIEGQEPGFGIIHVRLVSPKWRDEEVPR